MSMLSPPKHVGFSCINYIKFKSELHLFMFGLKQKLTITIKRHGRSTQSSIVLPLKKKRKENGKHLTPLFNPKEKKSEKC